MQGKRSLSHLCEGSEPALFGRVEGVELVWFFLLAQTFSPKGSWWSRKKRTADLQWKVCARCNGYKQIQTYIVSALFKLKNGWFVAISLFIFGPKVCSFRKSGSAQLASWLSRKNQAKNINSAETLVVLEGLFKARQDERQYVGIAGNMNWIWTPHFLLRSTRGWL